jgi:hypothetical protein
MKMSNIANQLVAVVATLLGFVTHDALTRHAVGPATIVASSTPEAVVDPFITRSVNLEGLPAGWLADSSRAERAGQPRPVIRISGAPAATRPNSRFANIRFADNRLNKVRVAAPDARSDAFIR